MVKIKIKDRLTVNRNRNGKIQKRVRWDTEKLKEKEYRQNYQQALENKIKEVCKQEQNENKTVEEQWNIIKEMVIKAAKETIGEKKKRGMV